MSQSRDFGPQAAQMRSALERYAKEELIDLMTHILRVYVLEDTAPLAPDVDRPRAPEELTRLTFPQLLLHLQMSLEHEELGNFRVSGNDVFVRFGDTEFLLGGPAPELAPEPDDEPPPAPEAAASEGPPSAPVTGETDFDLDEEPPRPSSGPPRPEPLGPRAAASSGGGSSPRSRVDALFGGSSGLASEPPAPPPPIADIAPGDPSPEEQKALTRGSDNDTEEEGSRPDFDDRPPPALAEGDKAIKSSNRFADLELD